MVSNRPQTLPDRVPLLSPDVDYDRDAHEGQHVDANEEGNVKTVQITLDEELAQEVDRTVEKLGTTRSGFTRHALRDALAKIEREELERRQRRGYERNPVKPGEFDVWDDEQVWVD